MKSKLESVVVHLTNACANKCPYCYAYKGNKAEHGKRETILRIIDELSNADVRAVSFLGGDPVLHPNLLEFITYAYNKKMTVSVMSNSMSFKNCVVNDIVDKVSAFETTIHGDCATSHDMFCERVGAYDELVSNLRELSKANAKIGIAINVIPSNVYSIYSMIDSLVNKEGINISYIIIQRIVQFGRAMGTSIYKLSKENANVALEQIDKISKDFGMKITVEDPFPLCVIEKKYHKYMHSCEWGFTKAAISSNGDFSRCGADPRCLLGNIFDTPISEIWSNSPILLSFRNRDYLSDICAKCADKDICGGGCPLSCETNVDQGLDYLFVEYNQSNGNK